MKKTIIDFNKVYESNNYGSFKIIEDLGAIGTNRKVRIKFLDTGYENEVYNSAAIRGNVRDNTLQRKQKNTIQIDFDRVYESNNYGPFKIIEDLGGSPKKVRIKFINTGYEKEVQYETANKGTVRDYSLLCKQCTVQIDFDKVYESNNYGPFKIIEDLGGSPRRVRIKFIDTGYENGVIYDTIIRGEVRDRSLPRIAKDNIQIDFDKVYESKNYGPFKIIENLGGSPKRVRIKFLDTGFEKEVIIYNAIEGNVRDNSLCNIKKESTQIDFDKVYESNNYGPFKIIEGLRNCGKVRIKFINTGYENEVTIYNAIKGKVRDRSLPRVAKNDIQVDFDKVHKSNNYGPFKIIEDLRRDNSNTKRVRIKFLNTGYENEVDYSCIAKGNVRDNSINKK